MHEGHVSVPSGEGPFPGVVVLQDAFGLSAEMRRVCDHLASQGYLAYIPSLYQRGDPRCVQQVFRGLLHDDGPVYERIKQARDTLAARPDCTGRVGVVGFCMGGRFALVAGGRGMFDAASVNYGLIQTGKGGKKKVADLLTDPCPVVASFGGKDKLIPARDIEEYREALEGKAVPVDLKVYPEASHSFFQSYGGLRGFYMKVSGMTHDPEVSADAWGRIFAFFEEHLAAEAR
ncbi:dienelactone hydrolase family protein [Actinocorallia aurantiaca]|uniref:Dienelactone hydrolase family protein n=1 Tax=Actinocorallia aurantiaca TaxID=46204 RepID=A0ABN3U828_9ACTN